MNPRSIQPDALLSSTPSPSRKYVRALRVAAWNAAFIVSGLLLIALVGEVYFRLTRPFIENSIPYQFVEGVGRIRKPNAEVLHANWSYYVVSRTNSQGFLDREPVSAERAAAGCHIAFIGDSFVEAIEVPIADKFHVRLEYMAARDLPHLDIATQAYGIRGTGQINQLPFYDEYARHLNPKLIVLVFFLNDFFDNSAALHALAHRLDPDRMPYMFAQRDANGGMKLRPPDAEYARFRLPLLPMSWHESAKARLVRVSYFAKWLIDKVEPIRAAIGAPDKTVPQLAAWADVIGERPCCTLLREDWQPAGWDRIYRQFAEEYLPPVYEEALEYTAFGIDQFKRRADRDGAHLAILSAAEIMGRRGDPQFDRLSAIAEARGIPVISHYDDMVRRGYNPPDGRLPNDFHWNATGHQWAAEAILEWLKENQDVCD